jgi:prolyl-tRNA editing enzyme YbaK/EbsC (Cys-tRNA(Pro) deacylase)
VGCRVSQIAKSVVFRAGERACLVVAPGDRRVSAAKLRAALGSKVSVATAEFVLGCTGFEPGGVSPLGHQGALRVMIDAALLQEPAVWIAAGSRWSVARLSPQELIALSGGQVLDLSEGG